MASCNNQFLVVTHSPYLITKVLEEIMPIDELTSSLAMFVAYQSTAYPPIVGILSTIARQIDSQENQPEPKALLQAVSRARPAIYAELADFVAQVMDVVRSRE